MMIRIGLLRIVLYFSWIAFRLNCIHSLLKENIRIMFATSQKVEVNHVKKLYTNLWTLKQHLNERYNWTLCTAITAYFCSFLVGLYWILMRFQFQRYQSMAGNDLSLFHIFCFSFSLYRNIHKMFGGSFPFFRSNTLPSFIHVANT